MDGQIAEGEYLHSKTLSGSYKLYWSNNETQVFFAIEAKTEGWVGIGFQPPDGNKKLGVDFILGYIDLGVPKMLDMYSEEETGPHQFDDFFGGSQDILSFSGTEADGITIIEFSRMLDTGDNYDYALTQGNAKILWAYSERDGIAADHRSGSRGYDQIAID